MISDEEAAKIRQELDEGWWGPVLLIWLRRLLQDRGQAKTADTPLGRSQRALAFRLKQL